MRGEIMAQRQRDYAAAGRVMGYGWARILFRHLLPNAISPVLVFWMTDMALVILLGIEPRISGAWRAAAHRRMGRADRRWQELHDHGLVDVDLPGCWAIVLAGIGFSLLGDGGRVAGAVGDDLRLSGGKRPGELRIGAASARSTAYRFRRWDAGEVLGIVGELGLGKSLTLRAILQLLPVARRRAAWRGGVIATCLACRRPRSDASADARSR